MSIPHGMKTLPAGLVSLQGNENLVKVFLQYIQRCCSRSSPQTATHLLSHELTHLLKASTVVRPEVRHGAMSAVYAAMTAAVQCDEVGLLPVLGFQLRFASGYPLAAFLSFVRRPLAAPLGAPCCTVGVPHLRSATYYAGVLLTVPRRVLQAWLGGSCCTMGGPLLHP